MKKIHLLLLMFLMFSCRDKSQKTPNALTDNSDKISRSFGSTRGTNLVDKLYDDLLKTDAQLKNLDEEIRASNEKHDKVNEDFESYNETSKNYYSDANAYARPIKDSILKQKLIGLLLKSKNRYDFKISSFEELQKNILKNSTSIDDNYIFFKTILTIPIIEKFQTQNLPAIKPLENYFLEQNKLVQKLKEKNK